MYGREYLNIEPGCAAEEIGINIRLALETDAPEMGGVGWNLPARPQSTNLGSATAATAS